MNRESGLAKGRSDAADPPVETATKREAVRETLCQTQRKETRRAPGRKS